MDDYKAAFRAAKANRSAGQQLSREQVRAMRARRDNSTQKETETETGTKAARERDQKTEKTACSTMPPPPPRAVQKQSIGSADFHEDSQATRIDGGGAIVNGGNFRSEPSVNNRGGVSESTQPETATTFTVNQSLQEHGDTPGGGEEPVPSVSGSTVGQDYGEESVRGQERGATSQYSFPKSQTRSSASGGPGPTHSSNAEVSGALPTGFFDDSKAGQASKGQNVQNVESEFDAFMEEVKNIGEEATVGRLGEGNEGGGVSGVEPEGGTRAIDYNDFEQFVRREHLREIQERLNLARKHRLAPSSGSAAKEVASALEIAGIEPEVEFPKVVLPPLKQRRVEMDPKDEADDELELLDWRSKKLPST